MNLYIDSIYNVDKSILINIALEEDIEECVQDVFLDAWNNIEKFNPERGAFKTWLLILCKYKALNMRKSLINKTKIIELEEHLISSKENLEESYLIKETELKMVLLIN